MSSHYEVFLGLSFVVGAACVSCIVRAPLCLRHAGAHTFGRRPGSSWVQQASIEQLGLVLQEISGRSKHKHSKAGILHHESWLSEVNWPWSI